SLRENCHWPYWYCRTRGTGYGSPPLRIRVDSSGRLNCRTKSSTALVKRRVKLECSSVLIEPDIVYPQECCTHVPICQRKGHRPCTFVPSPARSVLYG